MEKTLKRENKAPINYKTFKRGLYKKRLAPKGYAWLVVEFKKGRTKYSLKEIIPIGVGEDLEQIRAEQMILELLEHYGI